MMNDSELTLAPTPRPGELPLLVPDRAISGVRILGLDSSRLARNGRDVCRVLQGTLMRGRVPRGLARRHTDRVRRPEWGSACVEARGGRGCQEVRGAHGVGAGSHIFAERSRAVGEDRVCIRGTP